MSCLRSYIVIQSCLDNTECMDKYVNWNYTGSSPNAHIFKMYIDLPERLGIIWIRLWNKHKYFFFLFMTTERHHKIQTHKAQALRDSAASYWSHGALLYSRQFPSSCNTCSPPSGLCSMGQTRLIFHLWREWVNCDTTHTWHCDSYSSLNQISSFYLMLR